MDYASGGDLSAKIEKHKRSKNHFEEQVPMQLLPTLRCGVSLLFLCYLSATCTDLLALCCVGCIVVLRVWLCCVFCCAVRVSLVILSQPFDWGGGRNYL